MFKDLMVKKDTPAALPRRTFTPAVDVRETREALLLRADLPGVEEKDLELSVEGNALTIEGRVTETAPEGRAPAWRESAAGDWRRRFVLSLDALDTENIRASLKDGVLEVVIPKADQARKRRISVQAA
jgi:HSP20 family protein